MLTDKNLSNFEILLSDQMIWKIQKRKKNF